MNRHRALALGVLAVVLAGCTREIRSQDASTTTSLAIATTTSSSLPATTVGGRYRWSSGGCVPMEQATTVTDVVAGPDPSSPCTAPRSPS